MILPQAAESRENDGSVPALDGMLQSAQPVAQKLRELQMEAHERIPDRGEKVSTMPEFEAQQQGG